ncbi:caspase-3-like [Saccostrea echinata]|uniref:caspase-3-like n=1 Tax=Saccostrea echinata TaxID=191078 RepID=UPI002A82675F|nr:caspase-3-like [Saccostrea echinata]
MTEKSDFAPKTPKSSYKQLDELAQKNRTVIFSKFDQHPEGFLASLTLGEEVYTGIGSNKTTAKDKAAEAALEIWSTKITPEKKQDKTPVTKLNELCQQNRNIKHRYEELDKDADDFVFRVLIMLENEEGKVETEEEHKGKGRSKKDAKQNSASMALQRSYILQSFTGVVPVVKNDTCFSPVGRLYECRPRQTGYVLIVYFSIERDWADVDVDNIKRFMENTLRFRIEVVKDPTKDELIKVLEATYRHLNDHSSAYYCFTFFLMGHGSQFGVRTADKGKKKMTISVDEILEYFKNNKMPEFTGKPKMFFLQCCRGESLQETLIQPDTDEEDSDKIRVPTDGDILIAHATTEGYKAYRFKDIGSIFIFNCIKTFEDSYTTMHLEDMMIDVKAVIALDPRWRRTKEHAQMPCTWSTLTRRFYFLPTDR